MATAVVMVGEGGGPSGPVAWVQDARRAAARDLIEQLNRQPQIEQIVVVSPRLDELGHDADIAYVQSRPGPVHVGRQLSQVADQFGVRRLLYFGGGAAPLLDDEGLAEIVSQLSAADRGVFTNNHFATDWAGITPAEVLATWRERLPQDNMIGWVLSTEAGLPVFPRPASAASRLDIDTPTDLLTLRLHPGAGPHLRRYLAGLPLNTAKLQQALEVLARQASQVFFAGRIGPDAWRAVNRVTQCWIRVVSEERGMVSSGRLARGEVYSLLAAYLEAVGLQPFFTSLAEQAQAAFIDTRVMLAHHRRWPPEADRFASDLGRPEQISDPWLSEFTHAAMTAPIPIILGGHGLLAGDLFAICDLL